MARHRLIALTNAVAGREAEMARWYDEQHIPDVLRIDGVVAAQRFAVVGDNPLQWRFMTIYDVVTDDPSTIMRMLSRRFGTPDMPASDAMDMRSASAVFLEALGPRVEAGTPAN